MPWVRFDDHFPVNRKVDGLSDTAFRLHVSAIFWCARNLTDGVVTEEDLELVTARVRAPARFGTELVRRGLWHQAGTQCESEQCPPSGPSGWFIHDYFEYQPSKVQVLADREENAKRQREWRERKRNALHGPNNGASNGVTNALVTAPRPVPVPKEPKNTSPPDGFEEFWASYPFKRGGRKAALGAYDRALKRGADPEKILAGMYAYRGICARDHTEERFVAHASTWLNNDRWEESTEPAEPLEEPFLWPWDR